MLEMPSMLKALLLMSAVVLPSLLKSVLARRDKST